jgi:hypothetical protein
MFRHHLAYQAKFAGSALCERRAMEVDRCWGLDKSIPKI